MASTGIVTTGRGLALNLDDLIRKAEIPLDYKEGKATKESPAYKPVKDQKPRIRGFIPVHGEASAPVVEEETVAVQPATPKIASAYSEDGTARTLSDITGIRVKETDRTRKIAAEARGEEAAVEISAEEDQVLGDLVKELKTSKPGPKKSRKKAAAE